MTRRPDPPPPPPPNDVTVVRAATALWLVALVVALVLRDGWAATAAFGFGLGLLGVRATRRRSPK